MNDKALPILMNAAMVRAVLSGAKTQTRRIVKPRSLGYGFSAELSTELVKGCPFGVPGEKLYVRETWAALNPITDGPIRTGSGVVAIAFAATEEQRAKEFGGPAYAGPWKPSIHMPRMYSRITIEVTEGRVERLNEISQEDAKAEGAIWTDNGVTDAARDRGQTTAEANVWGQARAGWSHTGETHPDMCLGSARSSFINLWEKIEGRGSWDLNPLVWAISFKVVKS